MRVVLSTRQCILLTGRCLVSVRFYLVYRVGLVDKIFGLVDLVNKTLGLVNKPKWHFEMACILLMSDGELNHDSIEPTPLTGSLPRRTTTAACPLVPEPAETLREDNQAEGGSWPPSVP